MIKTSIVVGVALFAGCTGGAGPKGDPGAMGGTGANGADGTDGTDGTNGTNGMNGSNGMDGSAGSNGTDGTNGTNGADGNLRIYGDGTAGALTIAADADWTTAPPANNNYQFTNFTVAAGKTLIVWPGTVIRCSGSCVNNGTIVVATAANGGIACLTANGYADLVDPGADAFGLVAGNASATAAGQPAFGGIGYGVNAAFAAQLMEIGMIGGGGGAGNGGQGGGVLKMFGKTAVTNAAGATIAANGESPDGTTTGCAQGGGGGGGGGIVFLASKAKVTQAGTIDVSGGNGGPSSTLFAPGGGGAGGIIHLFAPSITNTGTNTVAPGVRGTGTGTVTGTPRGGGGSGGSSGAVPGSGAGIDATNTIVAAVAGDEALAGSIATSVLDPSDLF